MQIGGLLRGRAFVMKDSYSFDVDEDGLKNAYHAHREAYQRIFARLAVRYVSGYLETVPPPGRPRLVGADVSHAWVSVFVPQVGWVDLDPTNDRIADDQHVTLAWGRDYADVAPIKGVILGGGGHTVEVAVEVEESLAPAE